MCVFQYLIPFGFKFSCLFLSGFEILVLLIASSPGTEQEKRYAEERYVIFNTAKKDKLVIRQLKRTKWH